MSWSIQERGGKHQLRVKHKLLPRDYYYTSPDRSEVEGLRDRLLSFLAQGVVPQALLAQEAKSPRDALVFQVIRDYEKAATVTPSDLALLKLICADVAGLRVSSLSYDWVENWVRQMKLSDNHAPGTIRKRVGALGRAMDWHFKHAAKEGQPTPANPLRLLPRGYSQYTDSEADLLRTRGKEARMDEERDRRMSAEEESKARAAMAGEKRPDRERPLPVDDELRLAFDLILDTGIRLSEMYKLRVEHVDLVRGVLKLQGSKATRGQRKPRVVPLKMHLREMLRGQCAGRSGLVFSFWDGVENPKKVTARLSGRFATLFKYAGIDNFTEHDLRHEATCRWFELRRPGGGWVFSEIEICKIMGWTSTKMALRYASLRGEDLADRLL